MSINNPRTLGRYRIYDQIAAGGMATVHYGRVVGAGSFSRIVAIKRLLPNYASDPDFLEMFIDEARLAARVRHPNVVTTLDVVDNEEEVFLVMEYVHGEPLTRLLRAEVPIPVPVVAAIVCGMLEGLHAAHEAESDQGEPLEIVHRDVSPQNVLVGADGIARVFDFGIAKAEGNAQQTREGVIKGKVSYMAPEQVHAGDLDRRADLYSAGVVLWELLVGKRLRSGDGSARVVLQLARGELPPPQPPSELRPEVPSVLDAVVDRAVRYDREQRYATAREMALAIESAVRPATPREVSLFLASIAGDRLARSAAVVRAIEADPNGSEPRLSARGSSAKIKVPGSVSSANVARSESEPPSIEVLDGAPPRRRAWLLVPVLFACMALVLLVFRRAPPEPSPPPAAPAFAAPAPPPPPAISISVSAAPSPSPSINLAPVVIPRVHVARPTPKKDPAAPPPTSPPPPAAPAAKSGCENPFIIGPGGIRQVKPECL